MRKFMKCVVAYFLALMMTFSLVQVSAVKTKAAEVNSISLGVAKWKVEGDSYYFPNVEVSFAGGQKIFCISVDQNGYFNVPDTKSLGTSDIQITGLELKDDGNMKYSNNISTDTKLTSFTVITRNSTIEEIKEFIQNVTFYRNGVDETQEQSISVVTNSIVLEDDMTVIAIDGKLHYYKYVPWEKSGVSDVLDWIWYTAYEKAKASTFNGLKGYLATITSEIEQTYIYKNIMGEKDAWVGGARTLDTTASGEKIMFDQDTIKELNPGSNKSKDSQALQWRWLCGPESGNVFYTLNSNGAYASAGVSNGYTDWTSGEPNNKEVGIQLDKYNQEYCLQYGFGDDGKWNDWYPACNKQLANSEQYCVKGYLIEYSPYDIEKEDGSSEKNEEKTKSGTDTKTIPIAMTEHEIDIKSNDFMIKRSDVPSLTDEDLKTGANVSVTTKSGSVLTSENTLITVSDKPKDWTNIDSAEITYKYTEDGNSKTSTSTAYIFDEVEIGKDDEENTISIGANNFTIDAKDATGLAYSKVKEKAGAAAKKNGSAVPSDDITIDTKSQEYQDLVKGVVGDHKITFTYDGVSTTITATVTAGEDQSSLSAGDILVKRSEISTITSDEIVKRADVSGKDQAGNEITDLSKISVEDDDMTALKNIPKNQEKLDDITIKNPDTGKSAEITAYVKDTVESGTDTSGKLIQIGGNDFSVSASEAKKSTLDFIKNKAGVVALEDGTVVDLSKVTIDSSTKGYQDYKNGVVGTHEITFVYDGVKAIVHATVTSYPDVTAQDIIVERGDLSSLTEYDIIKKANVSGKDSDNNTVTDPSKFKVDVDDLTSLKKLTGDVDKTTVSVKYPAENVTTSTTVHVTDKVTTDDAKKIQIGANNFKITSLEADVIEACNKGNEGYPDSLLTRFKDYADVIALEAGTEVDRADITVRTIEKRTDGDYDVTFSYKGVEVTVIAEVEVPSVSADDFILSKEEAASVSGSTIKKDADATAYEGTKSNLVKVNDSDAIKVSKDNKDITDNISVKNGDEFTFTYTKDGKDYKDTAKAKVVDKTATGKGQKDSLVKIGANDFEISVEQAKNKDSLTELFKQYAGAVASVDVKLGSGENEKVIRNFVDTQKIASDLSKIEAKNGVYKVKYTYDGVSVEVNCAVKANGSGETTTPEDLKKVNTNITGNDFSIPSKTEEVTSETFKDLANIDCKDTDGNDISSTVDESDLKKLNDAVKDGKKGTYDVKVTSGDNKAQTTIHVTVTDEGAKNTTDNSGTTIPGETIVANNYTIGIDDFSLIKESANEKIKENNIKLANASAYKNDTKEPIDIVSVDTSKVKNEPGTYDVTFKTANGTTTTVKLTISDDWKTIGNVDKASEANKDSETTDKSNTTAVPNDKKTDDGKKDPNKDPNKDQNSKDDTSNKGNDQNKTTSSDANKTSKGSDATGTDKIFEKSNSKDVTNKINTDMTVDRVTVDDTDIPSGSYTIDKDTITIKSSVFSKYDAGTKHTVSIIGKDGSKQTFTVTVIDYDESTVIKKVPILKMQKNMGVGSKFMINLCGINKTAVKKYKSSNKKIATINKKGVIKAKKKGKCTITAQVIQNGSYYTVKVKVKAIKKVKLYNLKKKALSKVSGELPEFNVYKRVFLGKKTKLKFTSVEKDAKITYKSSNKKIATVTKKGVIKGKKQGFAVVTAKIKQNGKTYVTRIFVRVDDLKPNKNLKKYLK